MHEQSWIHIVGARQHNLKNIHVDIPRGKLTVITGPSGSGKSSLAFDTLYAEGQRRFVESLSTYARQFLEQCRKPDVDRIEGLSPTLAIEQRGAAAGPRSTVATSTELYDYLRVLFARVGEPRCWICHRMIEKQPPSQVVDAMLRRPEGTRLMVLAPLIRAQRGTHKVVLERLVRDGFVRARVDGEVVLIEQLAALAANRKHSIDAVVDRLTVKATMAARAAESVELAASLGGGRVIVAAESADGRWVDENYSAALACSDHPDVRIDELTLQLFSFNSPMGACPSCNGLGITLEFDPDLVVPDANRSLAEGAIAAWRHQGRRLNTMFKGLIRAFCERFGVLPDIPFRNIPQEPLAILLNGTSPGQAERFGATFEGVIPHLKRLWTSSGSESLKSRLHAFLAETPCAACRGSRLRPEALCVRIEGRSIADVTRMTIVEARAWCESLSFTGERAVIAEPLLADLRRRLGFLCDVGVEYLALGRGGGSLSGGEWQRMRLAAQMGGGLAGVCYVLDEPTVGLHPRDSRRLAEILRRLAALENTVVVVEHDEEVIAAADYMVDIGPGAGARGGQLVAQGAPSEVLACPTSLTAAFLSGKQTLPVPENRRPPDWTESLELHGVTAHNLAGMTVRIPLGRFVCVTGVSGSGKSTLVSHVLLRALRRHLRQSGPRPGAHRELRGAEQIDDVVEVDQSPVGRTLRGNPATYVGVFGPIRELFARTREAKIRGYGPARFSFNIKGGRCEHCEGQGVRRITMHFLPDVYVTCDRCAGRRFNRETLDVRYRGRTIADVLDMRVDEAAAFFENFAHISRRLQVLKDVGLGYLGLGQPTGTLSGGEAQRLKLASELHRAADRRVLYILDEPTTGLHFADIRYLLAVLQRLVERGGSLVCIEHHLDVIKMADWIIDLGPEGGEDGGRIVAEGPPEQIAQVAASHTGRFLKEKLSTGARHGTASAGTEMAR